MASLFTNQDVAMTTVIDKTKAVVTSYLATDHPSPPREGSPPPIPSWGTLDTAALQRNLPGSWVRTLSGEVRFVPFENTFKAHPGGFLFSTIRTTSSGSPQFYKSKVDAEKNFMSCAVLGVASSEAAQGVNVDKLITADSTPAALSFAESGDATPVVNLKIGNGPTET